MSNGVRVLPAVSKLLSLATVTCDPGYRVLEGYSSLVLQCMAAGSWNYSIETLSCEGTKPFQDGKLNYRPLLLGEACHYTGHIVLSAVLQYHSTWFSFSANRCPPVPLVEHAHADKYSTNVGTQVSLTCSRGYRFKSWAISRVIECNEEKQWSGFVKTDLCLG